MTLRKIAAFAIGPMGAAAFGFITLPIVTRMFSQEDVGRIAMLQVVCSFAVLLFSLGLDQAYVREYHETSNRGSLLKTTLLPGLGLLALAVAVLWFFSVQATELVFGASSKALFNVTMLAVFATFASRFFSLVLRMQERGLAYSMSTVLPKLLFLLLMAGYWFFGVNGDFENLALAHLGSLSAVLVILIINVRKDIRDAVAEKLDLGKLKSMLAFGVPLILGGLAYWGLTAMDRLALNALSNFSELGLYSVAVSFAAAATIFQSVFSTIWAPTVYRWAASGENLEMVDQVTEHVLAVVVFLFAFGGLFSWVVIYILPPGYAEVQYLLVSCLAYPLLYTLSETTVVGVGLARKTAFAMAASVIALIVNFALNMLLIPIYGAKGAAVATAVAFFVFLIVRTESSAYLWRSFPRLKMYLMVGLSLIVSVFFTFSGADYGRPMYLVWGGLLLISVVVFRKSLRQLICLIENIKMFNAGY